MRILVVDDKPEMAERAQAALALREYSSDHAHDVPTARTMMAETEYALFLLDIVMPGTSGKVLCREIATTRDAGIIMVSSLSHDAERIALLELGADDYIVKPYNDLELIARVNAVLRRRGSSRTQVTRRDRFGPWTLIENERHIQHDDGRILTLTPSETAVIRHFMANPNILHSREDLLAIARVRQHGGADDRSVDALIRRLRKKIEHDPKRATLIQTEWGRGFTFHPD